MTIYISYVDNDSDIGGRFAYVLVNQGHTMMMRRSDMPNCDISDFDMSSLDTSGIDFSDIDTSGINIITMLNIVTVLQNCDVFIAIITEDFINSKVAMAELSSSVFSNYNVTVIPIVMGDTFVPSFLDSLDIIRANNTEEAIFKVLQKIQDISKSNFLDIPIKQDEAPTSTINIDDKIRFLNAALNNRQLTLVCGAGVSISSGIPNWNDLLVNILNDTLFSNKQNSVKKNISAKQLLSSLPQSNLILGKYLRILLKDDFEKAVQLNLYHATTSGSNSKKKSSYQNIDTDMLKAIVDLARPKRNGKCLDSIITFNFDDLIERALSQHNIEYSSIWKEGQDRTTGALPIYHVHGYLPSNEEISEPNLVFSEEAYHSQFIDPYSWSNLIQLNTFSTNVCLFVGISLSDPNLRRLLDISWRKNRQRKHYIIMKKTLQKSNTADITNMLFEQDANSLGLNVIWCSDYSEVPEILTKILK